MTSIQKIGSELVREIIIYPTRRDECHVLTSTALLYNHVHTFLLLLLFFVSSGISLVAF